MLLCKHTFYVPKINNNNYMEAGSFFKIYFISCHSGKNCFSKTVVNKRLSLSSKKKLPKSVYCIKFEVLLISYCEFF